ncbi:TRAP transporter small permease [Marinicrinis lubricantis]|uniref:TRAP transporter small permease n=1 Tax=Marinicrinis lubricantis TaxID=2086470 RepID=A0ABW1IRP8_9BACL
MQQTWKWVKAVLLWMDRIVEAFALLALAAMTVIVTLQVFTRKLFNFVFFWSEEITLLLLIWFSFLGIAIGFREKLHLAMDSLAKRLPQTADRILDKFISFCTLLFGGFLVFYGWDFTVLMHANRMSATEWPVSVMYAVMPITGVLIVFYSLLHLAGIRTSRHEEVDEGGLD